MGQEEARHRDKKPVCIPFLRHWRPKVYMGKYLRTCNSNFATSLLSHLINLYPYQYIVLLVSNRASKFLP